MKKFYLLLFLVGLFAYGFRSNLIADDDLIRTISMGSLSCIAYRPDGTKLASAGSSGYIYLWDINSVK